MKKQKCCGVNGECLNALTIAAANKLACELTVDELNILSLFFSVLGDALGLIAATRACNEGEEDVVSVI